MIKRNIFAKKKVQINFPHINFNFGNFEPLLNVIKTIQELKRTLLSCGDIGGD
jgi:hypothetical protein